jgi:hypothetical protein
MSGRALHLVKSGAFSMARENPRECSSLAPDRTHIRIRSPRCGGSGPGSSEVSGLTPGLLRGATGSVRGRTSTSCMAEKARPRWCRRKAVPGSALAERRTEPCTDRPKLEARRQARAQPGQDRRKAVRRRKEEPNPRVGEASCGQCSASCAPGSRAVHGCSCRGSVAEVGERHLLRAIEGSREANRGCTE